MRPQAPRHGTEKAPPPITTRRRAHNTEHATRASTSVHERPPAMAEPRCQLHPGGCIQGFALKGHPTAIAGESRDAGRRAKGQSPRRTCKVLRLANHWQNPFLDPVGMAGTKKRCSTERVILDVHAFVTATVSRRQGSMFSRVLRGTELRT